MIRPATPEDIPHILRMGRLFWSQTAYASLPYCIDSMAFSCRQMMGAGLLLMAETTGQVSGSIGALTCPLYANRAILAAAELWFWVEPDHRSSGVGKELLLGLEAAAKARGVHLLSMLALEAVEPEKAKQIYLRAGYTPAEHTYLKFLGAS